jgi:hypothetical protein
VCTELLFARNTILVEKFNLMVLIVIKEHQILRLVLSFVVIVVIVEAIASPSSFDAIKLLAASLFGLNLWLLLLLRLRLLNRLLLLFRLRLFNLLLLLWLLSSCNKLEFDIQRCAVRFNVEFVQLYELDFGSILNSNFCLC